MSLPIVAIVGRPNVGKSTLFNFIVKQNVAITSPIAGTTRDRLFEFVTFRDSSFMLVDTGGIESTSKKGDEIELGIQDQVRAAIDQADVIVFLVDVLEGMHDEDSRVAKLLRQSDKPILFVASKADTKSAEMDALNFMSLGMGEPHVLSSKQGKGIDKLLMKVVDSLPEPEVVLDEEGNEVAPENLDYKKQAVAVSFIGRPNVGKSSLVNRIVGEERQIVSDVAGTTRDASSVYLDHNERLIRLVDTAGLRRQKNVEHGIEEYSNIRSIHAISRSDVVVLTIDCEEGITSQDLRLASLIHESATGAIICVNKWDLIEKDNASMNSYIEYIYRKLDFLEYAPTVFTSALSGQRVPNILDMAIEIKDRAHVRIPTQKLNIVFEQVMRKHPPARRTKKKTRPKIYYVTQVASNPLEFVVFVNSTESFHPSYFKFVERALREKFELHGVGIKFLMKEKDSTESTKMGGKKYARKVLGSAHYKMGQNRDAPRKD